MAGAVVTAVWHRVGPWATPALAMVEVALVWSGVLSLFDAVVVALVVEALLAAFVVSRAAAAVRRFRARRAERVDLWAAAQDGLAQVIPRRLARVVLIEVRLWVCLARWITLRYDAAAGFGYHGGVRVLVWMGVGLVVLEGGLLDLVLALALPGSPWVIVAAAVHVYGLVLLLGFYASLVTRPHVLGSDGLVLRESVLVEVTVPYAAITDVRTGVFAGYGRSWFRVDQNAGVATLAYGEANVALTLDASQPIRIQGSTCDAPIGTLFLTADRPGEFRAAVASSTNANATAP